MGRIGWIDEWTISLCIGGHCNIIWYLSERSRDFIISPVQRKFSEFIFYQGLNTQLIKYEYFLICLSGCVDDFLCTYIIILANC